MQSTQFNKSRAIAELNLRKFTKTDLPKGSMLNLLADIESKKLKIIDFIKPNIVIFEKKDCDYKYICSKKSTNFNI